jgi:hypothetical protein
MEKEKKNVNVAPSWVVVRNYNKGTKRNWSRNIVQEQEIVSREAQYKEKERNKTASYAGGEMREKRA